MTDNEIITEKAINIFQSWKNDWNLFATDVLKVNLDKEQQEILRAVQNNKMVAVASGTARGKDYVAAVAALCFMYLTPVFDDDGNLIENTKVALTAPTGRQVGNIMYPEIMRLFNGAGCLTGRPVGTDIRTGNGEWFLTGFKADDHNHEAWSGFHAVHTMFVVTEASGIAEGTFAAIEGNLQSDSKILIVFNPNNQIGYAARAMMSPRWTSFRLDDLTAPNVISKKNIIPGQVDYDWVCDKVRTWCQKIQPTDFIEASGDFEFEGNFYRPNDLFRVKVRGMFPETSEDVLIPYLWVEQALDNWRQFTAEKRDKEGFRRIGVDVAGMGNDSTVLCHRFDYFIDEFEAFNSAGNADHMKIAGILNNYLKGNVTAFIDTIGEGAGVFSRLMELGYSRKIYSAKASESGQGLSDITGEREFVNMRAYMYWALRDFLDPANEVGACLPYIPELIQELVEIKYKIMSNGKIIIEPKEDIKERLGRSPDYADSLMLTFYPGSTKHGLSAFQLSKMI